MNRIKLAITTASLFFIFGTILFLLQLGLRNEYTIAIFGYYYVLFAIAFNSIAVVVLLIALITHKKRNDTLKSIGVLCINIPVAFLYFKIIIDYLS